MTREQHPRSTTARRIGIVAVATAVVGGIAATTLVATQSAEASATPTSVAPPPSRVVEPDVRFDVDAFLEAVAEAAQAERLERFYEAVARAEAEKAERFYAAVAQAEAERAAAEQAEAKRRAARSGGAGMGPGWAALRRCESSGNYSAVSRTGKYRGAYQFSRATWDSVARSNYPRLVGVDPAAASPADQDAMALALYRSSGSRPWPHCGRHL